MTMQILTIIGIGIMALAAFHFYRQYKKADDSQRKTLLKVYAVLAVVSIIIFVGIRQAGISEKMFPEYYEENTPVEYGEW